MVGQPDVDVGQAHLDALDSKALNAIDRGASLSHPDIKAAISEFGDPAESKYRKAMAKRDSVDQVGDSDPDMDIPSKKKKGGKVHGAMPKQRLDKRARGGASNIHIKKPHEGLLHTDLGVKSGNKIPEAKLEKAINSSNPTIRKRAVFAENAKSFKH